MAVLSHRWAVEWFVILSLLVSIKIDSASSEKKSVVVLPNPEQNVMPFEPVHYSEPNISKNYQSSTKINSRGMGHLYYITKKFMNFILDRRPYPEG